MSDKETAEKEPLEPNLEEENLLRALRKNPLMAGQIQVIVSRFEQEVADGMNADEAEASLIKSLQELGVTMMEQWAHNTQKSALEKTRQDEPMPHKHSKKNSSGIPPLAP